MVENRSRRAPTPICVQRPRGAEILRSGNSLRRRAIALGHSPKPCAASRTLPPPLLDARKYVRSTANANMRASIGVTGYPRSGKLPAPLCHRSPALSQTVRPRGRSLDTKDCAIKKCSARLLTDPQERLPAKVEYALRANTWVLACVRLWLHHRSWLPVFQRIPRSVSGSRT